MHFDDHINPIRCGISKSKYKLWGIGATIEIDEGIVENHFLSLGLHKIQASMQKLVRISMFWHVIKINQLQWLYSCLVISQGSD